MCNTLTAQDSNSLVDNFNIDLHVKNMHLWHGFLVTPGVMMASSMEYQFSNQKFVAGLWGGVSFNGTYKEFSYYSRYHFTNRLNAFLVNVQG